MVYSISPVQTPCDTDSIRPATPKAAEKQTAHDAAAAGASSTAVVRRSKLAPGELATRKKPTVRPALPFNDVSARVRSLKPSEDPDIPGMSEHDRGRVTNLLRFHQEDHSRDDYSFHVNDEQFLASMKVLSKALELEHQANLLRAKSKKGEKEAAKRATKLQGEIDKLWEKGTVELLGSLGISRSLWHKGVQRGAVFYTMRIMLPAFVSLLTAAGAFIPTGKPGTNARLVKNIAIAVGQLVNLGEVVPILFASCVILAVTGFDKSGTWFTNLAKLLKTPMLNNLAPAIKEAIAEAERARDALKTINANGAGPDQLRKAIEDLEKAEEALDTVIHNCDMRAVFSSVYQGGFGYTGMINGVKAALNLASGYIYAFATQQAFIIQAVGAGVQLLAAIPAGVPDKVREQDIMAKYVARHVAHRYKKDFKDEAKTPGDPEVKEMIDYTEQHFRNSVTTARGAVSEPIRRDMEAIVADIAKAIEMDPKTVSVVLALRNYDGETLPAPVAKYMLERLAPACREEAKLQTVSDLDALIARRANDAEAFNALLGDGDSPGIDDSASEAEKLIDGLTREIQQSLLKESETFNNKMGAMSAAVEQSNAGKKKFDRVRAGLDKYDAGFTDLQQIEKGNYTGISEHYRERLSKELEVPNLTEGPYFSWVAKELARAATGSPEYKRAMRQAWARMQTPREFITAIGAAFWAFWQGIIGGENAALLLSVLAKVGKEAVVRVSGKPFPEQTAKHIATAFLAAQIAMFFGFAFGNFLLATAVPGHRMGKRVGANVPVGPKSSQAMGLYISLLLYLRDFQRDQASSTLPGTGFSQIGFLKNFWGNELASTIGKGLFILFQEPLAGRKVKGAYPTAHERLEEVRNDLAAAKAKLMLPGASGPAERKDNTQDDPAPDDPPEMSGALPPPEGAGTQSKGKEKEEENVAPTRDNDASPAGVSPAKAPEAGAPDEEVQKDEPPRIVTPEAGPTSGVTATATVEPSHTHKEAAVAANTGVRKVDTPSPTVISESAAHASTRNSPDESIETDVRRSSRASEEIPSEPKGKERAVSVIEKADDAISIERSIAEHAATLVPDSGITEETQIAGPSGIRTAARNLDLSEQNGVEALPAGHDRPDMGSAPVGNRRENRATQAQMSSRPAGDSLDIETASDRTSAEAPSRAVVKGRGSEHRTGEDKEAGEGKSGSRKNSMKRMFTRRPSDSSTESKTKSEKAADPGVGSSSGLWRLRSKRFGSWLNRMKPTGGDPTALPAGGIARTSGATPPATAYTLPQIDRLDFEDMNFDNVTGES